MSDALIEFKDVSKAYDGRMILENVNLKACDGDVTTIIGKSGEGKTVLLKHIIGLLEPDHGTILFRGKPLAEMSKAEWREYTGQISYMFQGNALFDSLTVFENVAFPLQQTTNLSRESIKRKVMERIEQTELLEVVDRYPSELSGGMQKRVALGRALVTDPKIVLFDEPTTGQDPVRRNAILSMISEYRRKFDFTAILVSHQLPDVLFISNRVLVLDGGKIIFQGTPEEFDEFDHPFMDELIRSLEGFQERLTGLYSKRNFRVHYQRALARKLSDESFVVAVFSLEGLDLVTENLGHTGTQQVLSSLGTYLNKHCTAVGGFSARQSRNQFITVLPFSDTHEAEQIVRDFAADLRERALCHLQVQDDDLSESHLEFSVSAGLAEGKSNEEMEKIFHKAESRKRPIARFRCGMRR
jgi:phospholipid/cholesterol/gamma-HCH transport system ATP-binding protein